MEDLKCALPSLEMHEFMFSFDISKGYYHIDLHPEAQKFFGFAFKCGEETYYGYHTVVPFGVNTGPYLFTKLVRLLVKKWHSAGIHIFVFIDDGLGMARTELEASLFASIVRSDLAFFGFLEQVKKSIWKPSVCLKWLGTIIDLRQKIISVPQKKRESTVEALKTCLSRDKVSARQLCRAAGLINSLALVIGNKAVIRTKQFYIESKQHVKTRFHWDNRFRMSNATSSTIKFWLRELKNETFERSFLSSESVAVAFSDASGVAGAAYINQIDAQRLDHTEVDWVPSGKMFAQNWNEREQQASSTWREVRTIEQGLLAFKEKLAGKSLTWFTDSMPGVSVIRKGSMNASLNPLAESIAKVCKQNKIDLTVKWIRRTENQTADRLSWFVDLDDWGIRQDFCRAIQKEWIQCDIDRFASAANTKFPWFNSKFLEEGCERVDGFSENWRGTVSWLTPPPVHIPKVIRHLKNCRAKGILVCPKWPSSRFWPFLFPHSGPIPEIKKWKTIQNGGSILVAGNHEKSIFMPEKFRSPMIAMLLDVSE